MLIETADGKDGHGPKPDDANHADKKKSNDYNRIVNGKVINNEDGDMIIGDYSGGGGGGGGGFGGGGGGGGGK